MKKNIILIHPMNAPDGKSFVFEHARRLMKLEKVHKAGWVFKNEDDAKLFEPKKIGNNADRVDRNSGKVKEASKKGNDNQSTGSRGEVKAA